MEERYFLIMAKQERAKRVAWGAHAVVAAQRGVVVEPSQRRLDQRHPLRLRLALDHRQRIEVARLPETILPPIRPSISPLQILRKAVYCCVQRDRTCASGHNQAVREAAPRLLRPTWYIFP